MGIAYNTNIVRDGLVLYLDAANIKSYPGTGTVWNDLSGLGGFATGFNNPVYVEKESFNFDGASDYFNMSRTDLNGGTFAYPYISIELWIKPGLNGDATPTVNNLITVENSFEISIGNNGNGFSSVYYASNPWAWYGTSDNVLKNNDWNQLVYLHADVGRWFFVNGSQVFYRGDTGGISAGSISYPYLTLMSRYGGTGSFAEGNLSNVKIYNRVLSVSEIQQNFNAMRGRYNV